MKTPTGYASRPAGSDPRSTEAWALGEASRRMALAAKMDDKGVALREALRLNQRLWSIFQAALTEPDCPLPQEIRDNVLALSIMVDRQVLERLGDLDGSKIGPILDINRAVAEGLSNKPAADAAQGQTLAQAQLTQPPAQPSPAPTGRPPVMRVSA